MFGNNKETTKAKTNSIMPSSSTHSLNSLVQGTVMEGTVRSESDIRIDGTIKGHLHCEAKVIIGPTGYVEGEVTCQNAVVEGTFDGNITVRALLNIRESAKVSGDVTTDKLIVQSGAVFNVTCHMGIKSNNQRQTPKNNNQGKQQHQQEQKSTDEKSDQSASASKATQA